MPCDRQPIKPKQTLQERMSEVEAAMKRLEQQLASGTVKIKIGSNGAIAFEGWNDRDGLTDVCAVRSLRASSSWQFAQALKRAEIQQGRKSNMQAVAAGVHSHDGGKTWNKGH